MKKYDVGLRKSFKIKQNLRIRFCDAPLNRT